MHRDAYQVAVFTIDRVKLISHNLAFQFRDHKIGMCAHNVCERGCVIAPQLLETEIFKREKRGDVARLGGAESDLLVALRGDAVVELIIGVEQAKRGKAALYQWSAQPVVLLVIARVIEEIDIPPGQLLGEQPHLQVPEAQIRATL